MVFYHHYCISNRNWFLFKPKKISHLEWTPFRDVDSCSYCEIELIQIKNHDESKDIINAYNNAYQKII